MNETYEVLKRLQKRLRSRINKLLQTSRGMGKGSSTLVVRAREIEHVCYLIAKEMEAIEWKKEIEKGL